ncbi:hypothetical protein TCAL_09596 [Tigriopus californicus]|uniref:Uncharacterized protein n=1 Tax=Tigriopus californicus TaxID=6832 RepID=A0A553P2E0_TIGCA|nr:uncharacterized protein LOC131884358 [Tigriopus californicus]TRY71867.1 hypothetical protein TCAL_09596 [Tigriopus californicus]|eukprot:TCALIF_09596-PA protein Name:"Protein of unknown function" AED:0.00 eAED:0.00 QI:406/1/1/1/1/1/2/328/588
MLTLTSTKSETIVHEDQNIINKGRNSLRIRDQSELMSSTSVPFSSIFAPSLRQTQSSTTPTISALNYVRLQPSMITSSPPKISMRALMGKEKGCFMWVHLQASICTEWAQSSMVLSPGTQIGARVTTTAQQTGEVGAILQALAGTDHLHATNGGEKQPKTIHRCILQRANRNKSSPNTLKCHVCEASYPSYDKYYCHLIDSTCANQKEALERVAQKSPTSPGIMVRVLPLGQQRPNSVRQVPHPLVLPSTTNLKKRTFLESPVDKNRTLVEIQISPDALLPLKKKRVYEDLMWRTNQEDNTQAIRSEDTDLGKDDEDGTSKGNVTKLDNMNELPLNLSKKANLDITSRDPPALLPLRKRLSSSSMNRGCVSSVSPFTSSNSEASQSMSEDNDKTTSETLNLLVGSISEYNNGRSLRLGKAASEELVQGIKADLAYNCPHVEATTLPAVSLIEHANDASRLSTMKGQLTNLMVSLLGESRITNMGYPETDILDVLSRVLSGAKREVISAEDDCTEFCRRFEESTQLRFRKLKREIIAARKNIQSFLEICGNNKLREQWKSKSVEDILQDILQRGLTHMESYSRGLSEVV